MARHPRKHNLSRNLGHTRAGGGPPTLRADYDAAADTRKRQSPRSIIYLEDGHLTPFARRKLLATAHDQYRNWALMGWMVRKHTGYVSRFRFQANLDESKFPSREAAMQWKRTFEAFIAKRSRREHFDIAGRVDRQNASTLTEGLAVLDGDCGWLKLESGHVQIIESDLIHRPEDARIPPGEMDQWVHGVRVDKYGKALEYCLCDRDGSRRVFSKRARAQNMLLRAYRFRADQIRGVSPLSSSLNLSQDVYETLDLNMAKTKQHAMLGIAILKRSQRAGLLGGIPIAESIETPAPTPSTETGATGESVTVNAVKQQFLKPGSAAVLELLQDEDIKLLESKTPSAEFRAATELMVHITLCALDLPYIFWDEKSGSFSIHRTARLEYEKSAKSKRDDNEALLNEWTEWQTLRGVATGELLLPSYLTLTDATGDWIPEATPWFDEQDEMDAMRSGIASGLLSPIRAVKERGGDVFENIDDLAKVTAYATERGLTLDLSRQSVVLQEAPRGRNDQDAQPQN